MDWKSPTPYATIAGAVAGLLIALGFLVPSEAAQGTSAIAQIAGGVLTIIGIVASVRQRRAVAPPGSFRAPPPRPPTQVAPLLILCAAGALAVACAGCQSSRDDAPASTNRYPYGDGPLLHQDGRPVAPPSWSTNAPSAL
jgi:hypothetical protein